MARPIGLILAATIGFVFIACGERGPGADSVDALYIRAAGGVAVVGSDADEPSYKQRKAVPSGDWSTIITAKRRGSTTEVVATDPVSGTERWQDVIEGRLTANVVSHDGSLVALSPSKERYYRYGRSETTFVIAGEALENEQWITIEGNFEPEAFSSDGTSLFVVSYLPARSPSKYQVRRLDLATGEVEGVFTPHAELQRAMGGTARIQAASSDGNRLYTLYTVKDHGESHAFIHVLDLENLWAHCIDLPTGFAADPNTATALAVAPGGGNVYVANTSSGIATEIDTGTLQVTHTATFDFDTRGKAHAAVDDSGTLYVASGPWVVAIDTAGLTELDRWVVEDKIKGLQLAEDAATLYVALTRRVLALDVRDGKLMKTLDPPGVGRIGQLGPVVEPVEEEPIINCAC